MFEIETQLKEDLAIVFKPQKVTFGQPSDIKEQQVLFINIEETKTTFKKKKKRYRIEGKATMFAQSDKMPADYFGTCIMESPKAINARFFFSEIDANTKYYQNLVQRDVSFIYFYETQYDPETGLITSVTVETTTED